MLPLLEPDDKAYTLRHIQLPESVVSSSLERVRPSASSEQHPTCELSVNVFIVVIQGVRAF